MVDYAYEAYEADESPALHELHGLHESREAYEAWLTVLPDQKKLVRKPVFWLLAVVWQVVWHVEWGIGVFVRFLVVTTIRS